ncbi:MAG: TMEM175 family protein [Luteolibacter sp.]
MQLTEFQPKTNRLEAFSDGVFAIIVTIMVFDVKLPALGSHPSPTELDNAFTSVAPRFFSFVISFLVVAVFWVHHHQLFHSIERTDRRLLWHNNALLLFLSLIPATAAFLGNSPRLPIAVALYGGVLLLSSLCALLMYRYAAFGSGLMDGRIQLSERKRTLRKYWIAPMLYGLGIAVAWPWPVVSLAIYVVILIAFLLPERLVMVTAEDVEKLLKLPDK